jgi:hypothetical protein
MLIDNSEVVIFFAHFEYGSALKFVLVVDVWISFPNVLEINNFE